MAITLDESKKLFRLTTKNTEYQMQVDDIGLIIHNYYGRNSFGADMSYQIVSVDRGFSGNLYENRRTEAVQLTYFHRSSQVPMSATTE